MEGGGATAQQAWVVRIRRAGFVDADSCPPNDIAATRTARSRESVFLRRVAVLPA